MTFEQLEKQDIVLRDNGILKGRFIAEYYATGYAYYKIIRVNKKTVRIRFINIGDGYSIPYWGYETSIDKDYVINSLAFRDKRDKILAPMKLYQNNT